MEEGRSIGGLEEGRRVELPVAESGGHAALTFGKARISAFLRSPGGLHTVQTDKYPIPPEQGQTRPEWHLSSATNEKRAEARFIAVMGVAKAGEPIALEGVEDATAGGGISVQFRRGGKPVTVSIDPSQPSVSVR